VGGGALGKKKGEVREKERNDNEGGKKNLQFVRKTKRERSKRPSGSKESPSVPRRKKKRMVKKGDSGGGLHP